MTATTGGGGDTGRARVRTRQPLRGAAAFRRDPLAFLTAEFEAAPGDVWRSRSGRLCVADPATAREVLGNPHGAFEETSDFFRVRGGVFGPRSAQIEIGRTARALTRRHLAERRATLPALVDEAFARPGVWPEAGNRLVHAHLRDLLLCPEAPERLHTLVDAIVARAVLAGARRQHSALSRLAFRRETMRILVAEIRARRASVPDVPREPRDLLDVTLAGAGPVASSAALAEVYLSFLFATVGATGFALAWSVLLAATHPESDGAEPGWLVREALRLWPVAWLFARTPRTPLHGRDLGGVRVGAGDEVDVCTYLVHRHPGHWDRPDAFVPERWARAVREPAYLPFGFGPHTCAGATVTMSLLEDLVGVLTRTQRLQVIPDGGRPLPGPALAPPRFTVVRTSGCRPGTPGRR
ncbi:cytochrome P450 [Streptomyces sp. NPDC048172]|uniref:cytochrome P450 n=1 Tax=Streptomyces sp. NPDC048172 TaxID=3365505 RepID=UPI00371A4C32